MARRFRFRLEAVRKLRERERDGQRRVVADAQREVRRIEQRIALLTEQLHGTIDRSREVHRRGHLDMVSLRGHQFHSGWLQRCILASDVELCAGRARVDAERARLGEVSKRLKVIENLRERQWTRYRAEVAREEQGVADEAALQMYLRKRRLVPEKRA
jgi:flagellar export protein FliJ